LLNQAFRQVYYDASPHLECYEEHKTIFPEECPFASFPEPGGLLPVGGDTNGGYAFWLTRGQPDDWSLVFYPHGFDLIESHPMPLVAFLVRWLSGGLPDCFGGVGKHFVNRTEPIFKPG
jgi:hypothetical protein